MPRVTVAGLGPGGPDLVTSAALAALAAVPAPARFVRTRRHPAAAVAELADATAFDDVYESADRLEDVYATICDRLVAAAAQAGAVAYAVPGSPAVAERTVELLRERAHRGEIDLDVVPALSFLDLAWARIGVDPVAVGVRVVDGHRFAVDAAGERGPLLVAQCDSRDVLSEVKLALEADDVPEPVVVLQRLGLPDERIFEVAWPEFDRAVDADHLTSLYIPRLAAPVASELARFVEQVRVLRERCPWDREQTHRTLTRYLLEEAYEVLEAILALDGDGAEVGEAVDHLEEELGDLLFQVVLHAAIATESGWFTLADVARGIHDKLERRHPHVFGDAVADTAGDVASRWEQIKKAEKGRSSLMDGIPSELPALLHAHKVQRKAASVGFDWPDVAGAMAKVVEEVGEVAEALSAAEPDPAAVEAEIGDLLFAVVNVARHRSVDPEAALRAATATFRARFAGVEALAAERGIDVATAGIDVLDGLWDEVKAASRGDRRI